MPPVPLVTKATSLAVLAHNSLYQACLAVSTPHLLHRVRLLHVLVGTGVEYVMLSCYVLYIRLASFLS